MKITKKENTSTDADKLDKPTQAEMAKIAYELKKLAKAKSQEPAKILNP